MAEGEVTQGLLFALQAIDARPMRAEPQPPVPPPEDQPARDAALQTDESILVQAPAGAGKTELLTKRFLRLLAEVEEPEQILAITFTRAATAEMRGRILGALERARDLPPGGEIEMADVLSESLLARAALRHAEAMGWRLLEQPHRLDVQTIDSLCLRLACGQPLLARLGGALEPTENAAALYAAAARRTTALLGGAELDDALRTLLLRRDNNLREVERMIASMLARRDAWLGSLPFNTSEPVDWEAERARLEQPFLDENTRVLQMLRAAVAAMPELAVGFLTAARYAAENLAGDATAGLDLSPLRDLAELPGDAPEYREQWEALASLLLTKESCWRRDWKVGQGFPAAGTGPGKEQRDRFKKLMRQCSEDIQAHRHGGDYLLQLLCQLRSLPALSYSDEQWHTLLAAFRVLRRASGELRVVFAEANAVDFIEIAQAAHAVLKDENSMRGLLESERKRHLLIDEFQDTSRAQYKLVQELLREWSVGDGRTVFLVGDPLQSIYGFRQAEVALFHETRDRGIPCGDSRRHCAPLQLTHNFRSHRTLVDALNTRLGKVFSGSRSDAFVPAHASMQPGFEDSFHLHPFFIDADSDSDSNDKTALQERRTEARNAEASEIVRILEAERHRIVAAEAQGAREYRVAVLVQARTHLAAILPALRAAAIPFRAVELEALADQPEVHDLLMLLRALLHTGERVAWLSVLRAPWCGLHLADLHLLTGADDPDLLKRPLVERISQVLQAPPEEFSPDGLTRLRRTWAALAASLATRYAADNNSSLAAWLERTWFALGGNACVMPTARENAESFFRLLDTLEPSGVEVLRGDFALRLRSLCAAPDARVSERFGVQLMTMHKAKGLGFEVVLLPGLERFSRRGDTELIAMLERARSTRDGEPLADELLLAPLGHRDGETRDSLYTWVEQQRKQREADERKRLLYVACTRARTHLHLFATVIITKGELRKPDDRSLLSTGWPGLAEDLEVQWRKQAARLSTVTLAASAADSLSSPAAAVLAPAGLERLPADWHAPPCPPDLRVRSTAAAPLFQRSEGSYAARARGTAMHALLEHLAALFAVQPDADAREVAQWRGGLERLAARALRTAPLPREQTLTAAADLTGKALAVAGSPVGRWLLLPHAGAASESAWQSWDADGNLRTLRVDRSFVAGEQPGRGGESCLWIIDYKTGAQHPESSGTAAYGAWRREQQLFYGPQLEAYGRALVGSGSAPPAVRYALYYPELLELIDWPAAL